MDESEQYEGVQEQISRCTNYRRANWCYKREDMVIAFGEKWRSFTFDSTNSGSELSARFKYDKKSRGWFVSVLSGVEKIDKKQHHTKTLW